MSKPKIKSQSKAQAIVNAGGKDLRVAKTPGTDAMLQGAEAGSGKKTPTVYLPKGALLAPALENVPHDQWPDELRAHYERALQNAEGAKLYQHGAGAGVGHQHKPVVDLLQQHGGLSPQEALDLARFRQHKQGIVPRSGATEALDTEQDVMARAAAMRAAQSPEERNRIEAEAKAREERLRQEHYFDELVGPKKRAIHEQQQQAPVGPPVSQAAPVAPPIAAQPAPTATEAG